MENTPEKTIGISEEEIRALNSPWSIKPNTRIARRLIAAGLITKSLDDHFRTPAGTKAVRAWIKQNV